MEDAQYTLLHSKKNKEIKIKRYAAGKIFFTSSIPEKIEAYNNNEVVSHNDCYYYSKDRKKLKAKAIEIKNEWIEELQNDLDIINNIKI